MQFNPSLMPELVELMLIPSTGFHASRANNKSNMLIDLAPNHLGRRNPQPIPYR